MNSITEESYCVDSQESSKLIYKKAELCLDRKKNLLLLQKKFEYDNQFKKDLI